MVLMPQITTSIGERESEAQFVAHVVDVANQLIGKYSIMEDNAYQGLRHEWLNHIFELVGVLCQPRPKPIMRKQKSATAGMVLAPRKSSEKCGRGRKSSHPGAQTSTQELALAKPWKGNTKFAAKSSRLSLAGQKASSTFTGGSGVTRAPKLVLNLFDSDWLASDVEAALPEQPQKSPRESSVPKDIPKSSSVKGIFK
jgi:hypothetical protein